MSDKAFPVASSNYIKNEGMDLRDWFASQVMAETLRFVMAKEDPLPAGIAIVDATAALSYKMADAMMKARKA